MKFCAIKRFFVFVIVFVNFSRSKSETPHIVLPQLDEYGNTIWSPRIVGGVAAYLGEFPAKVSIQNRRGSHFCGGTLINNNHVLTAAHCVTSSYGAVNSPSTYLLMGDSLLTRPGTGANFANQTRDASHVFVHPRYDALSLLNDIAVIRVSQPFNRTNTFYPVARVISTPPVNYSCSVAGWGSTVFNGSPSDILLRVDASIINITLCNASGSYSGAVRAGMFCAGTMAGGKDSCQGDSGSGLICGSLLAGIVSFGNECALPRFPGVYTDVASFTSWIESVLQWNQGSHSNITTPTTRRPSAASTTLISFYTLISGLFFVLFHARFELVL